MKKWLWILVIALPVLAAFETFSAVGNIDFAYRVAAPRYPEVTEPQLALLDNTALAKLSASLMSDHKKMTEWWSSARDSYMLITYTLLGLVFLFAAVLGIILWRLPSNPALESGRAKSGAPAQRER